MKRLLQFALLLALCAAFSVPARAAYAQTGTPIHKSCAAAGGVTTCVQAYTVQGAGHLVCGEITAINTVISSVTDAASSVYTTILADNTFSGTHHSFMACTCNVLSSGSINFTGTVATANREMNLSIIEFSGNPTSSCTDGTVSAVKTGTGVSVTTNTRTPSQTGDLSIMLAMDTNLSSDTYTGTSGYTCFNLPDTSDSDANAICYKVISGTSAETGTATASNGTPSWFTWLSLFAPPSSSFSPHMMTMGVQ